MNYIPIVQDYGGNSDKCYDIYSKLLKNRIIFLVGEIDDINSNMKEYISSDTKKIIQ